MVHQSRAIARETGNFHGSKAPTICENEGVPKGCPIAEETGGIPKGTAIAERTGTTTQSDALHSDTTTMKGGIIGGEVLGLYLVLS